MHVDNRYPCNFYTWKSRIELVGRSFYKDGNIHHIPDCICGI